MNEEKATLDTQDPEIKGCEAIRNLMPLYHEEKLSEEEAYQVKEHLLFCPQCAMGLAG